ncbi:ATP-binding protein [Bradyrhizobium sp. HKCCYLS2038]|uniref:ATP-binding protein n=1 Tax=unclassified Bradyrhizobium TaxID=2631580 RepID=UPI003EBBAE13
MFRRLGFAGRLTAIVLFALIALWASGVGWLTAEDNAEQMLSLPEHVGSIINLVETIEPSQQTVVLRALSSPRVSLAVVHGRPDPEPNSWRRPFVERILSTYFDATHPRDVIAFTDPMPSWRDWHPGDYRRIVRHRTHLAVSLAGGDYLLLDVQGAIRGRLFGVPPGILVGLLGALIGIGAVIVIEREARPLRALSKALAGFAGDTTLPLPPPSGAPEIRQLIIAADKMQTRISELIRGRTLLLGSISHDLKGYIMRIRIRAEQIPDLTQRARLAHDLEDMTTLLDGALAVSRGQFKISERKLVDLRTVLASVANDGEPGGQRVRTELKSTPIVIRADPVALRRLFTNLVGNALKYAPHCVIRIWREAGAVVAIDDDGPGIPIEARHAVFDPFFRIEDSRSAGISGTGLGLAIVKQIADAHGAEIRLDTAPEGGLRVAVCFPPSSAAAA